MGKMRILDGSGDTLVDWQVDDEESVLDAAEIFLTLSRERKMAFAHHAGSPATEATQIRAFDPTAEEIIWVRPITGG